VAARLTSSGRVTVNDRLHNTANGKMVSEWAKRPECVEAVFSQPFSEPVGKIPELRSF